MVVVYGNTASQHFFLVTAKQSPVRGSLVTKKKCSAILTQDLVSVCRKLDSRIVTISSFQHLWFTPTPNSLSCLSLFFFFFFFGSRQQGFAKQNLNWWDVVSL